MLQTAEQAMDAFPNQPRAYWYFGLAANEKGRYDDALSQLEQALLMTGNNQGLKLDIIDQVGRALIGKKDFTGARSRYEQVLTKGGDKHPGILEHYGDVLFGSGDAGKALDYWRKANAIRKSPELEQKIASGKR
ncbi:MAG: tetratricopeptide repeat protein [Lewinellaceae bacterium]|nr:tetratricopeptide repeat protein [Lewinellaceae bacterium]